MSKKKKNKVNSEPAAPEEVNTPQETPQQAASEQQPEAEQIEQTEQPEADPAQRIAELEAALEKEKKEYLFLMADFENFRRRTLNEKAELIKNGAEGAMRDLLPVVDDLERAIDAIARGGDLDSIKEGVDLIHGKFVKYLASQHVTPIESTGKDFNEDEHEAVTMFPAPDPSMKGKVIDTTIKGYKINDKVLRHAKVVVGS